jgi:two-component system CheB/CheR fusion protein
MFSPARFFRDGSGLDALSRAIFRVPHSTSTRPIRVWVHSGSIGEDTYSTAMCLLEGLTRARRRCRIRVFGTGPDAPTVLRARRAVYQEVKPHVSAPRLRRFFIAHEDGYRVADHVRELCVFAVHEIARNLPFVRLDAVVCLVPLRRWPESARERLFDMIHFSLRPGGLLLLSGEGLMPADDPRFEPYADSRRLYLRRPGTRRFLDFLQRPAAQAPQTLKKGTIDP